MQNRPILDIEGTVQELKMTGSASLMTDKNVSSSEATATSCVKKSRATASNIKSLVKIVISCQYTCDGGDEHYFTCVGGEYSQ